MGVYETTWAAPLFLEAMKFWFYSLCASLLLGVIEWFSVPEQLKVGKEKSEKDGGDKKMKVKIEERERGRRGRIVRKLVTDACDLFIPGSITGWLALESANVGWCSVVSTVLAGVDVWVRVQAER
jgi:hypothetical protein